MPEQSQEDRIRDKIIMAKQKMAMEKAKTSPRPESGLFESAIAGAAQGATLGFSDEMYGGVQGGIDWLSGKLSGEDVEFSDAYQKRRDEKREYYDRLQQDNPGTYLTGEVGGGLATALLPGGAVAKGAKLAKQGAAAAGLGAASGVGYGEGESIGDMATEAAIGGALGGASLGLTKGLGKVADPLMKGAGKVVDKVGGAARTGVKKTLAAIGGVSDENIDKYLKNPDLYDNAKTPAELAQEITESLESLKNRVVSGSQKARDLIPDDLNIRPDKEIAIVDAKIESLKKSGISKEAQAAVRNLEALRDGIKSKYIKGHMLSSEKPMQGKDVKDLMMTLDPEIDYNPKPGADTTINTTKRAVRGSFDDSLKELSPEYKAGMEPVAADAEALAAGQKYFRNQDNTITKLGTLGRRGDQKPEMMSALQGLDDRLGSNLVGDNEARMVAESFEKGNTNGSRNVLAALSILGGVGGYLGGEEVGGAVGIPGGALIGLLNDKYGPQMTKQLLRQYMAGRGVKDAVAKKLTSKFAPVGEAVKQIKQAPATKGVLGYKAGEGYGQHLASSPENAGKIAPFVGSVMKAKDPQTGEEKSVGGNKVEEVFRSNPSAFGKYRQQMESALERGPESFGVMHHMLMKNDPEYRQLIMNDVDNQ